VKEPGEINGISVVETTNRVDDEDFTAGEKFLAAIWQEALGVERVKPDDNFFDLGGHSLLGMQIIERIRKETGIRLRLQTIVLNTLRQIAAAYSFAISRADGDAENVISLKRKSEAVTTNIHQGLETSSTDSLNDYSKKKLRMLDSSIIIQDRKLHPRFFGDPENPLFGVYHPPDTGYSNDRAVLLCYPIGHEYMMSHFAFRRLARLLSDAGCHVFRFDYYGTGDSSGDSSAGDVDRWKVDVCTAFQELKEIAGVKKIYIVGVRFGATLAALSSVDDLDVNKLILWDPVIVGQNYIEELRIINDKNRIYFNKTGSDENFEELVGFSFPARLRKKIKKINLMLIPKLNSPKIVLITSENKDEYSQLRNQFESHDSYFEHHIVSDAHEWGNPDNFEKNVLVNETLSKIKAVIMEDSI
jgi:pimeloyl-ACP methyl ester carboxylesterase